MEVLLQIDAYDPVAAAAVTLYAASRDSDQMCHLNGQTWFPVIARLPVLRYDLFDGSFGRRIDAPSSGVQISTEPWPNFARYAFADARVRLWTGNVGDAWGSWTLRFDGRCTAQPRVSDSIAELYFAVDDRWLDTPLLSTYAGTGGAEGAAAQKGMAKPLALGAPRFVSGVLIDQTNNVVQLSSVGLIEDVEVAFEGLSRFSASVGDYASYAALVAATIPAGRWATAKAVGMVRHGAPLAGKPAYHVKGDKAGPDAWARKPGQLIRRIALLSGGSGKISDASLNALDVARPWNVSLYVDQQTTARELIQRIAASVNAVAGVSWLGQLFVVPIGIGTPSATLAADGSALPPIGSPQQIDVAAPWWRLAQQSEISWGVHSLAEVQFTAELIDLGQYSDATTYREGNIVFQPSDGNSYIYTSTTPSSGNSPPNGAYWSLYRAATSDNFLIADAFTYASSAMLSEAWRKQSGSGEISFVADATSPGGIALEIGNNSGNDMYWGVCRRSLPFSASDLYEISADIECIIPGTSTIYVGVAGLAADRATWVNINGANSNASQHYFAANADAMAPGQRTVFRGYFQGKAGSGNGTKKPDPSAPGTVHSDVAYVAPMFITGYNGVAARYRVHSIRLRKVEDIAGRYKGAWSNSTAYAVGEEVSYLTRRFRAIAPSTNVAPPATATSDATWVFVMGETSAVVADGSNRVRFSDFTGGANVGWDPYGHASTALTTVTSNITTLGFVYSIATTTATAAGQFGGGVSKGIYRFPVTAGERLAVSSRAQRSGTSSTMDLIVVWYADLTGTELSSSVIATSAGGAWERLSGFVTVPAGAQFGSVYVRMTSSGAGTMQVRCGQPMVSTAFVDQVAFPPYAPGPVIGAPSGTFVGATAAATVEGGAVAANNGVNSDGTIKTDKVATVAIVNGAVSGQGYAQTAGTVTYNVGTGPHTPQTLAFTASGNLIELKISVKWSTAAGSGGFITTPFYLKRNGTTIAEMGTIAGGDGANGTFTFTWVDAPSSGSYTYTIETAVLLGTAGSTMSFLNRGIIALELKR